MIAPLNIVVCFFQFFSIYHLYIVKVTWHIKFFCPVLLNIVNLFPHKLS